MGATSGLWRQVARRLMVSATGTSRQPQLVQRQVVHSAQPGQSPWGRLEVLAMM